MASFIYGLGKGLQEPVYPFREAYAFGAALNDFYADGWNAIPRIYAATTTFDLATISPGREVAVALLGISNTSAGEYTVRFKWTRDRDNALLYEYEYSLSPPAGAWLYSYSYVGWVDWEINENGLYHVDIEVSGPDSFSRRLSFNITGIPTGPVIPPALVEFMSGIIDRLDLAAGYMRAAWREVDGMGWPFYLLAPALRGLEEAFNWLAYHFTAFSNWVSDVGVKVSGILDQGDIIGLLRTWLDYAEWAWTWVRDAGANITGIIKDWWVERLSDIKGLIDIATEGFDDLRVAWDSFWNITFPEWTATLEILKDDIAFFFKWQFPELFNITTAEEWWKTKLKEVTDYVDTQLKLLEPLLAGWQELRDEVIEFFNDPWEWLWLKFTDWFLGPEE